MMIGLLLLIAAFVLGSEGILNPFAWWNCLPLALVYFVMKKRPPEKALAATTFAALCLNVMILVHLAWIFDWGHFATGSSTSGLIFIFLPVYSLAAGTAGWLTVVLLQKWIR